MTVFLLIHHQPAVAAVAAIAAASPAAQTTTSSSQDEASPQETPSFDSSTECYGWNEATNTETRECSNNANQNYTVKIYECATGTIVAGKCNTDIGLRGTRKNEDNSYTTVVCGNTNPSSEYVSRIRGTIPQTGHSVGDIIEHHVSNVCSTECYGWNSTTSTETKQCSNDATQNYGVRTYECVTGTIVAGSNKCNTNIGSRGIRKNEDNIYVAVVCGNTNPSSKYSNTKHRNINQEGHSVGDTIKHYSNNNCSAGGTEEPTSSSECYGWNKTTNTETRECSNNANQNYTVSTYECAESTRGADGKCDTDVRSSVGRGIRKNEDNSYTAVVCGNANPSARYTSSTKGPISQEGYSVGDTIEHHSSNVCSTECYGWNKTTNTETRECSNNANQNYTVSTYECAESTRGADGKCDTDVRSSVGRGIRKNEDNSYTAVVCGNANPSARYTSSTKGTIVQEGYSIGDTIEHHSSNVCSTDTEDSSQDSENTDSQPQAIIATQNSIVIDWEQVEEYKEFLDNGGTSGRVSAYCTTGINCIRGGSTGWTFKVINAENVGNYDNLLPSKEYLFGIATESVNFIYLTATTLPEPETSSQDSSQNDNAEAINITSDSIVIDWEQVEGYMELSRIHSQGWYPMYCSTGTDCPKGDVWTRWLLIGGRNTEGARNQHTTTQGGLSPNTEYEFRMRRSKPNKGGWSDWIYLTAMTSSE